jgi:UDP-GlcNAc:undecaprenyl-phosphate/decaprenyl-phosphate GlcNAc-1-phosphate transferase
MTKQYLMFCIAFIVSIVVTPFVIKLAIKLGALDVPKDNRRVHKTPIPLIGGLAIYFAFVITVIVYMHLSKQIIGILLGGTFITISGLIDDIKPMRARIKLILQIIAAVIVVSFGIRINFVSNPLGRTDGMLSIGFLSIPATIFWIVGVTNAFNLIDGLDGLAAGIASISCITLFVISLANGRMTAVMLTATLAGSTIGFLPYNFNPAKIFMGDTGAQFLGFILAATSIEGAVKSAAAIAITVPILALGLPIYDTLMAIIRRYINKRPVMEADRGHLHHKLLDMGLTQKQAVLVMYLISGLLGLSAVFAMGLSTVKSFLVLIIVIFIVFIFAKEIGFLKKKKEERN